jgi:small GTP-binding protein
MGNCNCMKPENNNTNIVIMTETNLDGKRSFQGEIDCKKSSNSRGVSNPKQNPSQAPSQKLLGVEKKNSFTGVKVNATTDNSPSNASSTKNFNHSGTLKAGKVQSGNVLQMPASLKERRPSGIINREAINIILLGDSGVGKSSFVIKFIENKFEQYHIVTLGTETLSKQTSYNGKKYLLNFIVTSGDPEYRTDYTSDYQSVDFFLVFYDVTNKNSFESVKSLIDSEIKDYLFLYKNEYPNVIFIGNKCDMNKDREVKTDVVSEYCKANKFDFYEISVKTGVNLSKVVNKMVETFDIMAQKPEED